MSSSILQIVVILRFIRHRNEVFLLLVQAAYRFHMPWDNSVNKMAHIHAAHTTLGVRNMPLTSWVRPLGSISLFTITRIYRAAAFSSDSFFNLVCRVTFRVILKLASDGIAVFSEKIDIPVARIPDKKICTFVLRLFFNFTKKIGA